MDSPQRQLSFDELQLQLTNMESPLRQRFQPTLQQLDINEPPLQQTSMKPLSYHSQLHLNFNGHEIPPPRSDITLNTEMENKIVWYAISDIYCELQACSPPGVDIHWPYGEMDKPLFDIPFFSGKIDFSSLPDNREMD
ncbi:hypothetical protein Ddye_013800 [Dipteronia dyeriana]|uniref:Uncharacterized protein n=1 Tax=Dipteronia dyeriana TaxID=168575 RepID=A0AAE0CJX0_9ROSI|nr:hypothetical protein Ddye_013793 [Dipteronia dyeriana]KAK2653944.1 hypothetical protein Ddye_013800 [Dipteronia dyeriana]